MPDQAFTKLRAQARQVGDDREHFGVLRLGFFFWSFVRGTLRIDALRTTIPVSSFSAAPSSSAGVSNRAGCSRRSGGLIR